MNLNAIHVAAPCPANWADMPGDDRVRHCVECNLNVYNLSAMTADEIAQLVGAREGRLCVRFYRRTDGAIITQDCPHGLRASARRAARRVANVAAAVLSALLSVSAASAKSRPQVCTVRPQTQNAHPGVELSVVDPQGALIPNARVFLVDKDGKTKFSGATSAEGELSLTSLPAGAYTLTVAAAGFRTFTSPVAVQDGKLLTVKLQMRIAEAKVEVEVKAEAAVVMGGITYISTSPEGFPTVVPGRGLPAPVRQ